MEVRSPVLEVVAAAREMGDMVNASLIQPTQQPPIHVVQVVEVAAANPQQVGRGRIIQTRDVYRIKLRIEKPETKPVYPAKRPQVAQSDAEQLLAAS